MRLKRMMLILAMVVLLAVTAGCPATTGTGGTGTTATQSSMVYSQAQTAYLNTWNSYHAVWAALPETDARKAKWVKDYHPKFLMAATALVAWGNNPGSLTDAQAANAAIDQLTAIMVQLAIPVKGGK
jgi:hypothetical protein